MGIYFLSLDLRNNLVPNYFLKLQKVEKHLQTINPKRMEIIFSYKSILIFKSRKTRSRNESCHEKTKILHMQNSFPVTEKLITFVFATWIVQFFYFLNPKFRASSHLQCSYSLVCVRPVQKPDCWFSHDVAQIESGL